MIILFGLVVRVGTLVVPPSCDWALSELFHVQRKVTGCAQDNGALRNRTDCISNVERASLRAIESHANHTKDAPHLLDVLPPIRRRPVVVDIGCGLAVYHLKIEAFYSGRAHHYLVDRSANEVGHKRDHGYRQTGDFAFYNSLECALGILQANGVASDRLHAVNASSVAMRAAISDGSAHVIMSLLSWGYHYPIGAHAVLLELQRPPRPSSRAYGWAVPLPCPCHTFPPRSQSSQSYQRDVSRRRVSALAAPLSFVRGRRPPHAATRVRPSDLHALALGRRRGAAQDAGGQRLHVPSSRIPCAVLPEVPQGGAVRTN